MTDRMETPPCPVCASRSTGPHPRFEGLCTEWTLFVCSDCGTGFLHPMPEAELLARYYDQSYYGVGGGKFVFPVEGVIRLFRRARAAAIRNFTPSGRVLDVGCGRGLMLSILKDWGYEVDGVELDTIAARRAQKNLGKPVFHSLTDVKHASARPYQVISFWHSLEHMPCPGDVFALVDDLLDRGGLLVVAAPHLGSIQSRLAKASWLHLDLPRHLIHFDMGRLALFLRKRGYEVLSHDQFSQEYNVIDTLCYLYGLIGFDPLLPFKLIKNVHSRDLVRMAPLAKVTALTLAMPLGVTALMLSNLFSALGSGSTTTLFLRKLP